MIADHIASLPEKWQRVSTTLRKVTIACSSEWQNIHRKKDISEYCEVIWQGLTTSECVLSADHTNGRAYASVLRQSVCLLSVCHL